MKVLRSGPRPLTLTSRAGLLYVTLGVICSCTRPGANAALKAVPALPVAAPSFRVRRQSLSSYLEIASEFIPYQQVDVRAEVSGYIKTLLVDWGTRVRAGQLMAVLLVPQMDAQVEADRGTAGSRQQDLARARHELASAISSHVVAHLTYKQLYGMQKTGGNLVSQEQVDIAKGEDLKTGAAVAAAKDAVAADDQAVAAAQCSARLSAAP
jgi:multidrug efflux pump subunit AcrA (membrane-fusion protein)